MYPLLTVGTHSHAFAATVEGVGHGGFAGSMAAASAVGGVAGATLGARSAGKAVQWIENVRATDAQLLEQGHTQLPPIPEPDIGYRKERHFLACFGGGIALGGFLTWLIVGVGAVVLSNVGNTDGEALVGEIILTALFVGGVAGVFGFVFPGLIIGSVFWAMESRARLEADKALTMHAAWRSREELRAQLESGDLSPVEAAQLLRGEPDEPVLVEMPGPVLALPTPGMPLSPKDVLALASAVAAGSYVKTDMGPISTPSRVQRILTDPHAPDRETVAIYAAHVEEAEQVFVWAMGAYDADPRDEFRERVGYWAVFNEVEPTDAEAIRALAAGVGGYRRARSLGIAS